MDRNEKNDKNEIHWFLKLKYGTGKDGSYQVLIFFLMLLLSLSILINFMQWQTIGQLNKRVINVMPK